MASRALGTGTIGAGMALHWSARRNCGATGGYHLVNGPTFSFDLLGALRFDGLDMEDLGVEELAARGIDRNLLEDRDDPFDAGLGMRWRGSFGEVQFRAIGDVTDTSGGQEISLTYLYACR